MKWYAVIGRLAYDEDDTVYFFRCRSEERARLCFRNHIFRARYNQRGLITENDLLSEAGVIINFVISSDTPLQMEYCV